MILLRPRPIVVKRHCNLELKIEALAANEPVNRDARGQPLDSGKVLVDNPSYSSEGLRVSLVTGVLTAPFATNPVKGHATGEGD